MKRFAGVLLLVLLVVSCFAVADNNGELRFCLRSEPKTFNPILVADDASETVRYLTGGVLVRVNRQTQALEPELATSWKVSKDGRMIEFKLRENVRFSDGTPFTSEDVASTVRQLMDPAMHSPTGDAFRSGDGKVAIQTKGPYQVTITFPVAVVGLDRQFDQVAIMSARSGKKEMAVLGPFYVAEYKPGAYVQLKRNPNYWKRDNSGKQLPYIDGVRLDIVSNRDVEMLRFRRGEVDLINSIDTEYYDRLASSAPKLVRDAGVSLDSEQMWFNQVPTAPIPEYKRAWFRSQDFRRAVSLAINRADLCRVVFASHATPANGPISPANRFWYDSKVPAPVFNPGDALLRLQRAGFRMQNGVLRDAAGNTVEFSIVTNAGNKYRERMATMIQQDLKAIGIKVNVVTLDFPSLIERIMQNFQYEAAMLGLTNVELDPNAQMNVWLSSSENHQWNPGQKQPATAWEAEIDRLMRAQASTADPKLRKKYFDRVQEIVYDQAPFIYLVHKNALAAVSPDVQNASAVVLRPQTYWNAERLWLSGQARTRQ